MSDPYRITETSDAPPATRSTGDRAGGWRPLVWVVLVVSVACNAVFSSLSFPIFIGIAFGLVALASGVTLAVDYYRRKRG